MALVQYGGGVTEMRGSVGGTTFSRNRGGAVARRRTYPVKARVESKLTSQQNLGYFSNYWANTLSITNKTNWKTWANNTPLTNRVGETYYMSGHQAFVRYCLALSKHETVSVFTNPTTYGLGSAPVLSYAGITVSEAAQTLSFAEATFTDWSKSVSDDILLIYQCVPCTRGNNFIFYKEYFIGSIEGDSGAPPAFPQAFNAVYPFISGMAQGILVRRIRPTRQVSACSAVGVVTSA